MMLRLKEENSTREKVLRALLETVLILIPAIWTVWLLILACNAWVEVQAEGEASWTTGIRMVIVAGFDLKFIKSYLKMDLKYW